MDWRKALIRYVLSMKGNLEILPWTSSAEEFVVYRGQSGSAESKPGIPRIGDTPIEIQTTLGNPISTSKYLTATILRYSWPKPGRLFKIHVKPGVKYVSIPDLVDASFDDLSLFELDLGEGGYKTKTPAQLRGTFKDIVAKENEVLLKLDNTEFKTAAGDPETWTEPEVPLKFDMGLGKDGKPRKFHNEEGKFVTQLDITLYETYLSPKTSGRGRTFRKTVLDAGSLAFSSPRIMESLTFKDALTKMIAHLQSPIFASQEDAKTTNIGMMLKLNKAGILTYESQEGFSNRVEKERAYLLCIVPPEVGKKLIEKMNGYVFKAWEVKKLSDEEIEKYYDTYEPITVTTYKGQRKTSTYAALRESDPDVSLYMGDDEPFEHFNISDPVMYVYLMDTVYGRLGSGEGGLFTTILKEMQTGGRRRRTLRRRASGTRRRKHLAVEL